MNEHNRSRDARIKAGHKLKTWLLVPRALEGLAILVEDLEDEIGMDMTETRAVNILLSRMASARAREKVEI